MNRGYLAIGPIKHLKKGWAIIPFIGRKAHYWTEEELTSGYIDKYGRVRFYNSLCGLEGTTDDARPAIDPGNWQKCKRCLNRKGPRK